MPVTVNDAGPFEKLITFEITETELDAAKTKAARRLSRDLKIHGFRPGKAPRPIVEATVGSHTLRKEAIDEILPERVGTALAEIELEPAAAPLLESLDDTEDGIHVQVRVAIWPTLGDVPEHHDRRITVGSPEVTSEELETQIERLREQFAELETVERAAAEGDYVAMDTSATRDGVDVPEASASQILYEVGSGGFIEGVDEVLVGMSAADEATFDAPLPPGFGERAGLEVKFTVVVTEVRQKVLPELTDSWIDEVTEFETVAEMRETLAREMGVMKKRSLASRFRDMAVNELVDQIEIELPEALVREEMDEVLHRFVHRLEQEQLELTDYIQATGISQEEFLDDLRLQSDRNIRTRLLLEAVAGVDGLEVTDEELNQVIDAVAAQSDRPDQVRELFHSSPREKSLVGDILRNKALDAIVTGAIPVDDEGRPVDLTIEESVEETVVEGEVIEGDLLGGAEVVEAEVVEAGSYGEEE